MKRSIKYIGIFAVASFIMLIISSIILYKDMTYVELSSACTPQEISTRMKERNIYNYLNIYDIYSNEKISVYSGNMNILLKYSNLNGSVAYSDDEIIVGNKNKNFSETSLNTVRNYYGKEYSINGIIDGTNKLYFKDLDILNINNIKKQYIYIAFSSSSDRAQYTRLCATNIFKKIDTTAYVINYRDITSALKIIICILLITGMVMVLLMYNKDLKRIVKDIVIETKKYLFENNILVCIFKKINKRNLKKALGIILLDIFIIFFIIFIVVFMSGIKLTFTIDFSSLKSILSELKYIYGIVAYSFANGFSKESFIVTAIITVYILLALIIIFKAVINKIKSITIKNKCKSCSMEE